MSLGSVTDPTHVGFDRGRMTGQWYDYTLLENNTLVISPLWVEELLFGIYLRIEIAGDT